MNEQHLAAGGEIDWEAACAGDIPDTPGDQDVVRLARELPPGTALGLGCGSGQNSIWLGARGWRVHGVDMAQGAIERAAVAAAKARLVRHVHGNETNDLPVVMVVAHHPGPRQEHH